MKVRNWLPGAGVPGLAGLTLLGLGILSGCGTGDHAGDGADHSAHDHGAAPEAGKVHEDMRMEAGKAHAAKAAEPELKSREPSADYALKTCVVSGEGLDAMGGPVAFDYDGTEVQFCCEGCIKKFRKDPTPFLEKIRAAKK